MRDSFAHGSFGLVNTGERKLLITCHHVWEQYEAVCARQSGMKVQLALGPYEVVSVELPKPVDREERLDLVSFDMSRFLDRISPDRFFPLTCDHPPPVRQKDQIAFIGYSGTCSQEQSS